MLHRYRALFLALSVAILLLLAYTAWWSALAWRLRTTLAEAPGKALAEKGVVLDLRDPEVSGFPLTLTVEIAGLRALWPSGTVVETGAVTATAFAWAPMEITVASTMPMRLDLAGSARHAPVTGSAEGLTGQASLGLDGKPKQVTASLRNVRSAMEEDAGTLAAGEVVLTWTAPPNTPEGPTDPQGQTSLLVKDLDLPGAVPAPLTRRIDQLALSYEARGPLPTKPSVDGMTGWRDGGGSLDIRSFRLLWGGVDLRAHATLTLDGNMQPAGAGTAELSGAGALVEMMAARENLPPEKLEAMKAGLRMLTRRTYDGRDVLSVPVTLRNNLFSVGPVVVGTIPEMVWH